MTLDLSKDYLVIDDPKSITYSVKLADGGSYGTPTLVPYCYWEPLNQIDYQKRPYLLKKQAAAVHAWVLNLSGIVPKMSDFLVDDLGITWYVEAMDRMDQDSSGWQRYRMLVYQEV